MVGDGDGVAGDGAELVVGFQRLARGGGGTEQERGDHAGVRGRVRHLSGDVELAARDVFRQLVLAIERFDAALEGDAHILRHGEARRRCVADIVDAEEPAGAEDLLAVECGHGDVSLNISETMSGW